MYSPKRTDSFKQLQRMIQKNTVNILIFQYFLKFNAVKKNKKEPWRIGCGKILNLV